MKCCFFASLLSLSVLARCTAAPVVCTDGSFSPCGHAYMNNSEVLCADYWSCFGTKFVGSHVTCNASDACVYARFVGTAVECPGDHCTDSDGYYCSCCNGPSCPGDVASCSDDVDAFCAQTFLGRTCKDWGNPVCASVSVASQPPLHPASSCLPFQEEVHFCESSCEGRTDVSGCAVVCPDVSSCSDATFTDSHCLCGNTDSCVRADFYRSNVTCRGVYACTAAHFYASAVDCQETTDCPDDYDGMTQPFDECSCCTGPACPSTGARCADEAEIEAFCAACKESGNPICGGAAADSALTEPPNPSPATTVPPTLPQMSTSSTGAATPVSGPPVGCLLAGLAILVGF